MEPDASFEGRSSCTWIVVFFFKFVQSNDTLSSYANIKLIYWYGWTSLTLAYLLTENVSLSAAVCVCVCVCLSVCLSLPCGTNQSLGLNPTCQARRLSVATLPLWCSCVRVDVPTLLTVWPCTAWWLNFRRRNFLLNFSTPVFKMWIIQKPKKVALWNKRHFEEEKTESVQHV